jgi:hypothetical protein
MTKNQMFDLSDEDLEPVLATQHILREALGSDIPLEVLVPIAVRCIHSRELATTILATLRARVPPGAN